MSKFPRLEMMRAQRQRLEDEITAPYQAELRLAAQQISLLRRTVRTMEEFFGREVSKRVIEEVAYNLRDKLMQLIFKAVASAKREETKPIPIMLPPDLLRFMDPGSIEQMVLQRYTNENLPNLRLSLSQSPDQYATVIDIRVPELGHRQIVAN